MPVPKDAQEKRPSQPAGSDRFSHSPNFYAQSPFNAIAVVLNRNFSAPFRATRIALSIIAQDKANLPPDPTIEVLAVWELKLIDHVRNNLAGERKVWKISPSDLSAFIKRVLDTANRFPLGDEYVRKDLGSILNDGELRPGVKFFQAPTPYNR